MRNFFWVLLLSVFMVGCGSPTVIQSPQYLVKSQTSDIGAFGGNDLSLYAGSHLRRVVESPDDSDIQKKLSQSVKSCQAKNIRKTDAGLIPVAGAILQLIYSNAVEKRNKKLEALKKSATGTYSAELLLQDTILPKINCLIVSRHDQNGKLSAATFVHVEHEQALVQLKPQFTFASSTLAYTKTEEVDLNLGFSIIGVGKQENGLPIMSSSGVDTKKIGTAKLNGEILYPKKSNIAIGPIPAISNDWPVILKVSIVETGNVGFDIDERIARNAAIKELLGPALSDGLKAYLEED